MSLQKNRELVKKLSESFKTSGVEAVASATASEFVTLNLERDSLNKELLILKHTVNELEGLIETQRQTLSARDVSIKTLLSMLQVGCNCVTVVCRMFAMMLFDCFMCMFSILPSLVY